MGQLNGKAGPATSQNFTCPTPARKCQPLTCRTQAIRLRPRQELRMVDQGNIQPPHPDPNSTGTNRRGRRGMFLIALLAVALMAGLAGNMLSAAFGQAYPWHHF